MSNENMFESAVRNKFRFPYKGMVSTEDLWDIPLEGLDSIFKTLNSQVKIANEESLLTIKTKEDETLNTKIEIVKYIVNVKLAEENARLKAREKREQKQKIMGIMAAKQNSALYDKSVEELKSMLDELE